jgi:hypothetical protein
MGPNPIFISYRRDDAAGYARAVYDALARRFGAERVFMDVDDIHAGEAFADVIRREAGGSALLLVLIGRRWLGERPGQPARITEAADFVRIEVAAALLSGARVIPLLLDGAPMPTAAQLPDDLRALAGRNALELDNSRYAADIERLVDAVAEALGEPRAVPRSRASAFWIAVAAVLLAALALVWSLRSPPPGAAPASRASAPLMARAAVNGTWQAALTYDWPNARYTERFVLGGEGGALHGSASFLGVPRGVLEGALDADTLHFVTRTQETGASGDVVHRYRAKLVGDELQFVMQTEGGSSAHVPVVFVARRAPPKP